MAVAESGFGLQIDRITPLCSTVCIPYNPVLFAMLLIPVGYGSATYIILKWIRIRPITVDLLDLCNELLKLLKDSTSDAKKI